jgi:hypothetical protein
MATGDEAFAVAARNLGTIKGERTDAPATRKKSLRLEQALIGILHARKMV